MRQSVRHSHCAFLKHLHTVPDLLSSLGTQNKDSFMTQFHPVELLLYSSAQVKVEKDLSDVSWWSANEVVLFYPLLEQVFSQQAM